MIRTLAHPLVWLLGLMPFIWIDLTHVGGFSVNLSYVPALAVLGVAAFVPAVQRGAVSVAHNFGAWILAYLIYLPILQIALAGSEAQGMPIRQVFFIAVSLVTAAWLAASGSRARIFRTGGALALVLVIVVMEVLARRVGLSWIDAITRFATSGDLNFVIYGFFRRIFNAMNTSNEVAVGAAAKNALAVAVFTAGILFRAGYQAHGRDIIGMLVTALVLGLLVMLNTRSVLLMAFLSLPLVWLLSLARRGGISVIGLIGVGVAVCLALLGLAILFTSENALFLTLQERFSFNDASAGSRFEQLNWAFGRIETAIFTGSGYAEIGGHPVHNLFVGAWMHAGFTAFVLVVAFYSGLLLTWVGFLFQILSHPETWRLPMRAEWIAVLPIVPMFRVWLSGDAGHMNFVEWIAVGAFVGVIAANRMTQTAVTQPDRKRLKIVSNGHAT